MKAVTNSQMAMSALKIRVVIGNPPRGRRLDHDRANPAIPYIMNVVIGREAEVERAQPSARSRDLSSAGVGRLVERALSRSGAGGWRSPERLRSSLRRCRTVFRRSRRVAVLRRQPFVSSRSATGAAFQVTRRRRSHSNVARSARHEVVKRTTLRAQA